MSMAIELLIWKNCIIFWDFFFSLKIFLNETFSLWTLRRVWRYQRGNWNPYIEEEQRTQWPKEIIQKDKQRSTKHTYKTKDRVTQTPLKPRGELRCSTSDTHRVNLVTNPVRSHERGKDREVEHISGHLWHRYSIPVNQVMVATVKLSKWWLQPNQEEPLVQ
jgi:hypothetical protein